MNIIGLGSAGCRISQCLSKYDAYKTFQIDNLDDWYKNFIMIEEQDSHESYEKNYKQLDIEVEGPTTLILSGAGKITGTALRILEQLNNPSVGVMYIKPRLSDISDIQKTRNRVVSQILQQFARSGLLKEFLIIDNEKIEKLVKPTIVDFWTPINKLIADTFHMVNVFKNTEPLLKGDNKVPPTAKISTLSLVDFENSAEELFYDLMAPRAKSYYFALTEAFIKENKNLLSDVRTFVSSKQEEKCDCAYSIFQTAYKENYAYGYHHATLIQEQDKNIFTSEAE